MRSSNRCRSGFIAAADRAFNAGVATVASSLLALVAYWPAPTLGQVGSAFTYQGELEKNGSPYDGSCNFVFRLWDASTSGQQIGNAQAVDSTPVASGRFTVVLDFGATAFLGAARWLESSVQCSGDAGLTTLSPRQAITASPYALSLRPGARVEGSIPAGASFEAGIRVTNSSSSNGIGLFGIASATSGTTIGVAGNTSSGAGFGVYGGSNNGGTAVRGEAYANGRGVWGSSIDWQGIYGSSVNQVGVVGESTNFDGVWGIANAPYKAGVAAIANGSNGLGLYATSNDPFGFAMLADGNARQALARGGFVKAMARVEDDTIVACYNSQGQGLQIQTPPCGFAVTNVGNGFRHIDFGFAVGSRFPVVTPLNFPTSVAERESLLESGVEQLNGNVVAVYALSVLCENGFCSSESTDFFIILF